MTIAVDNYEQVQGKGHAYGDETLFGVVIIRNRDGVIILKNADRIGELHTMGFEVRRAFAVSHSQFMTLLCTMYAHVANENFFIARRRKDAKEGKEPKIFQRV